MSTKTQKDMEILDGLKNINVRCCFRTDDPVIFMCDDESVGAHLGDGQTLPLLMQNGRVYVSGCPAEKNSKYLESLNLIEVGELEPFMRCLCKEHDNLVFQDIRTIQYDGSDKHNFVLAFQSTLFNYGFYERLRLSYELVSSLRKLTPPRGKLDKNTNGLYGLCKDILADESCLELFHFWDLYKSKDYSQLLSYCIKIPHRIYFAAGGMKYIPDKFDGTSFRAPMPTFTNLYISVIPSENAGYVVFSSRSRNQKYFEEFTAQFEPMSQSTKEKVLTVMLSLVMDYFVFSPILIDSWDTAQKNNFLELNESGLTYAAVKKGSMLSLAQTIRYNLFDDVAAEP